MDDLISRQAAIDAANDWLLDCFNIPRQNRSCGLIRRLEDLPPAQSEVIHCRDCKHWRSEEYIGNNNMHTLNIASLPCKNWLTDGDWYCGSALRKE